MVLVILEQAMSGWCGEIYLVGLTFVKVGVMPIGDLGEGVNLEV